METKYRDYAYLKGAFQSKEWNFHLTETWHRGYVKVNKFEWMRAIIHIEHWDTGSTKTTAYVDAYDEKRMWLVPDKEHMRTDRGVVTLIEEYNNKVKDVWMKKLVLKKQKNGDCLCYTEKNEARW